MAFMLRSSGSSSVGSDQKRDDDLRNENFTLRSSTVTIAAPCLDDSTENSDFDPLTMMEQTGIAEDDEGNEVIGGGDDDSALPDQVENDIGSLVEQNMETEDSEMNVYRHTNGTQPSNSVRIVSLSKTPVVFEKIMGHQIKQELGQATTSNYGTNTGNQETVSSSRAEESTRRATRSGVSSLPLGLPRLKTLVRPEEKFEPKTGRYYLCPNCQKKYVSAICVNEHLRYCGREDELCVEPNPSEPSAPPSADPPVGANQPNPRPTMFYCTLLGCKSKTGYTSMAELQRLHIYPEHFGPSNGNVSESGSNQKSTEYPRKTVFTSRHDCYHCKYCNRRFKNVGSLKLHIRHGHRDKIEKLADADFRSTARPAAETRQLRGRGANPTSGQNDARSSNQQGEARPAEPGMSVASKSTLLSSDSVRKRPAKQPVGPFRCEECQATFTFLMDLEAHTITHRIDIEKPYACSFCEKSFFLKAYLLEHEKSHINEYPFLCRICGECFTNQKDFDEHSQLHQESEPVVVTNAVAKATNSTNGEVYVDVVIED